MSKLMIKKIINIKDKGKYFDGHDLYLLVTDKGKKLWRGKYRYEGKEKLASYGAFPEVSLEEARIKHALFRASIAQGIDPLINCKRKNNCSFWAASFGIQNTMKNRILMTKKSWYYVLQERLLCLQILII